ncbi:receptor-type tyrosine-protein phosphatase N2-like [Physella acuta]|uniref:receptor-type tyrosine-protein phosphatase N2-like n=1 Tax=Physella acuta TaxID=109671 RepID=UPI0027DC1625|nr:receptor-type tyrosine-protein phosphatase N2-like [Physella acuta]
MDRVSLVFILVLGSLLADQGCSSGASLNPFPLGTIGCLVSDVCGSDEICTNDLLFGSCQTVFTRALKGENKFELETSQIERLEDEIRRLIEAGFTWKDAFTQCTLQNALLAFSRGRSFNRRLCEAALVDAGDGPDVNGEIANVLLNLLESGKVDDLPQNDDQGDDEYDVDGLVNSNKRDEIVQVHKYFDKSTGLFKRNLYYKTPYRYLDLNDLPETEYQQEPTYRNLQTESVSPLLEDSTNLSDNDIIDPNLDDIKDEDAMSLLFDDLVLSPEDKLTLENLLKGTILPTDLSPQQQRRLQKVVEVIIRLLEFKDNSLTPTEGQAPASDDDIDALSPSKLLLAEPETRPLLSHDVIEPRQGELLGEPQQEKQLLKAAVDNSELELDKKTIDTDDKLEKEPSDDKPSSTVQPNEEGQNGDAASKARAVDSHSMYLQLSKEVSTPVGLQFVQNMTEILKLPPGLIFLVQVGPGRMVSLNVNTDPKGTWDAEKIAKEAQNVNEDLVKATGISIEGAGVGRDGNRVEVKQNNRYVVLTFILVGTIAGVVLAVVTIYLIKRHARSKQKLSQLATNADGNEASKDYQDLCRQRMQGKSSEKPEPLHAASRIGSVSETQVRSPSSRSSTSSWSEEPAATNMDISTGHIVLSYMEDHLKNQDRLDREWEAVSSYVADPSSTKMATDQSNTRKNRFADVLPYDHSRVILSSNANVSNSDYINASFITDHDPRNPAYICTQGPLPHTVADFWQMIWEQGSVVIVMLTKLAENGSSLCHRYWPEEGSDLYHIYEVHLVSEHIWCDDYLVRSFYLKNLQTNETRTVTQFHFLTWPDLSVPASIKALLDFRRKVNKSFRGRSCPIVVHCSDGCGRSGTYCLIDMVLNKMAKGAKEIDMAATLEHIRDQRMTMVKTKEQFQFSLAAVAEEVHAILKALPQ